MLRFSLRYVCGALAFLLADYLLPGLWCDSLETAILAGACLMLFYLLLRPLARLLTFALNLLTLRLLGTAIDSLLILLTARLFPASVRVAGIEWAVMAAILINLVRALCGGMVRKR